MVDYIIINEKIDVKKFYLKKFKGTPLGFQKCQKIVGFLKISRERLVIDLKFEKI